MGLSYIQGHQIFSLYWIKEMHYLTTFKPNLYHEICNQFFPAIKMLHAWIHNLVFLSILSNIYWHQTKQELLLTCITNLSICYTSTDSRRCYANPSCASTFILSNTSTTAQIYFPTFSLPRKMCLNFHSTSWRSRAMSSCAGGCWVKSYNQHQGQFLYKLIINTPQPINPDKKIRVICWILTYQGRKHLLSSTAGNRESPVSTRITCRQSLAEVICRLFAHYTHLNWKEAIYLLLLHKKKSITYKSD